MNNIDNLVTMQYFAGKPWVLAFMWLQLNTDHPPNIAADQAHLLMATAFPDGNDTLSRTMHPGTPQKTAQEWREVQESSSCHLVSKFPKA